MTLDDLISSDVSDVFLDTSDFAETVTFQLDAGNQEFTALVSIEEPIRDSSGFSSRVEIGQIQIPENKRADVLLALAVTVRNESWRVTDITDPEDGMCNVGIQRDFAEHSNAVDLEGNQHRYG